MMQSPLLERKPLQPIARTMRPDHGSGHFLMMVCDAAQRFLLAGEAALLAGQIPKATANILRAQSILVELMGSADRAVMPDLTRAHTRVCQRVIDHLSEALATGDAARAQHARRLLLAFQEAWSAAALPPAPQPLKRRWRHQTVTGACGVCVPSPRHLCSGEEPRRGRNPACL